MSYSPAVAEYIISYVSSNNLKQSKNTLLKIKDKILCFKTSFQMSSIHCMKHCINYCSKNSKQICVPSSLKILNYCIFKYYV